MDELIKALRNCLHTPNCGECPRRNEPHLCQELLMNDAADAIERLMEEVESKDKTNERMRDLMRHYKAAYRTAYKLYQEARNEL